MSHLALWQAVEKTPPAHTKPITGKAYKGNSPKPHYLVWKATETFGPCGIGWGFNIISERVEPGVEGASVHIAHIRVWYIWNNQRGEVEHVGQTMFTGKNKNGLFTDEDAPKKSITDGLVKALSMIGFAGDIFMGRYDDSKYVRELEDEARQEAKAAAADKSKAPPARKEAAPPVDEDESKTAYIAECRKVIDELAFGECVTWWNSSEQKKARADFGFTQDDSLRLRALIEAKKPAVKEAAE